ncbi:unnamed protein product [Protopolystoma xenopodis]|uniref:Uncharacterized protein n=1 Tax=Protopolystoma xenopodis TaxID=117903 RepID=A0A448XA07_9PLAT|nr:unnamed protein product [Protopolystoma xenopodis]
MQPFCYIIGDSKAKDLPTHTTFKSIDTQKAHYPETASPKHRSEESVKRSLFLNCCNTTVSTTCITCCSAKCSPAYWFRASRVLTQQFQVILRRPHLLLFCIACILASLAVSSVLTELTKFGQQLGLAHNEYSILLSHFGIACFSCRLTTAFVIHIAYLSRNREQEKLNGGLCILLKIYLYF